MARLRREERAQEESVAVYSGQDMRRGSNTDLLQQREFFRDHKMDARSERRLTLREHSPHLNLVCNHPRRATTKDEQHTRIW